MVKEAAIRFVIVMVFMLINTVNIILLIGYVLYRRAYHCLEARVNCLYKHGNIFVDGSKIVVLSAWVMKIERLANSSTHWQVGQSIHQVKSIGQEPRFLDRLPVATPTTYNLAGGLYQTSHL